MVQGRPQHAALKMDCLAKSTDINPRESKTSLACNLLEILVTTSDGLSLFCVTAYHCTLVKFYCGVKYLKLVKE
jgi:hypothetical protein